MDSRQGPWLFGYGLEGVKGITHPIQVGPLAKVNFLVGRNNHGKSSVMQAAERWVLAGRSQYSQPDFPVQTLHPVPTEWFERILQPHGDLKQRLIVDRIACRIDESRHAFWLNTISFALPGPQLAGQIQGLLRIGGLPQIEGNSPTGPYACVKIPAFRELRPATEGVKPSIESGEGLVAELGSWQTPVGPGTPDYHAARQRWEVLTDFMREVLEDPNAGIEVANNQTDLHVRLAQAGRMLHIDDLGDGVKQVLMIAAATVAYSDHLVLLEEPEIHLHAGLQRKLMRFLAANTKNQYIIATHSAHVLDLPGAAIFHVTHDGSSTRVAPAVHASDVQRVCQDLGYMASDLLQANYTIWVEGPSDRIYWRHWLSLVDPELTEGVHYVIMSYGGSLISEVHLEGEPQLESDLIQLLRLGRACTVIADSDKSRPRQSLRPSLQRLVQEARKPGSGDLIVCEWASTVENLLPRKLFREVVESSHPRASANLLKDAHTPFTAPFKGMSKTTYSKVDIARKVVTRLTHNDLDRRLMAHVKALAGRVREANGLVNHGKGDVNG